MARPSAAASVKTEPLNRRSRISLRAWSSATEAILKKVGPSRNYPVVLALIRLVFRQRVMVFCDARGVAHAVIHGAAVGNAHQMGLEVGWAAVLQVVDDEQPLLPVVANLVRRHRAAKPLEKVVHDLIVAAQRRHRDHS